jgi:cytochrome c-type biogenesis protein
MIESAQIILVFLMGVGTFLSPCAVALLPAYVAYFAGLGPNQASTGPPITPQVAAIMRGFRFGASASGGIVAVFAVFGLILYALRMMFDIPSSLLVSGFGGIGIVVGILLVLLGILLFSGRAPTWTPRFVAPKEKTVSSMMLFGGIYALASLGCTLPLFFAVLFQIIAAGPIGGSILLVAYVTGFAGFMFVATLLLAVAEEQAHRFLRKIMPYVKPVSGVLLIGAGIYVLYYYLIQASAL